MALRKAWRKTTRLAGKPLALAVRMKSADITSIMFERMRRMKGGIT